MKLLKDGVWQRRGISLLWGPEALANVTAPNEVMSIRQFLAMVGRWPEALPANGGKALVVAGLEGCLDLIDPSFAEEWLKSDLLPAMLAFQDEYSLEAALIFWLPTGKNRVKMNSASDAYSWICAAPHSSRRIEIGRILWAGAAADAARIIDEGAGNTDPDGPGWIGLHHPRIS